MTAEAEPELPSSDAGAPEDEAAEMAPTPEERFPDLYAQLFTICTARASDLSGRLQIGATAARLEQALGVDNQQLLHVLNSLADQVRPLGLEMIEYSHDGEAWYCIRSRHGGPTEISEICQGVLGVILALAGGSRERRVPTSRLRSRLVEREYLKEFELDKALRTLDQAGYIRRGRGQIYLGPRTQVELTRERMDEIAHQAKQLIL